jgi:hypothetical protein
MEFVTIFLRSISLLPSLIQGVERSMEEQTGAQRKEAVLQIVGSAINIADAVTMKQIADSGKFTEGLNAVIDGVVTCLNASIWAK